MHSPPHPGSAVKYDCIQPLGLSITDAAKWLGVTRSSLSHVVNGQASISPAMALRLEAAGWGVAEGWLRMQVAHDLSKVKQRIGKTINVKPFPQPAPELAS